MNLNDLHTSRFLKKEDVGAGVLVTISRVTKENIAMEGADPEYKAAIYFEELDKPLTLNSTNGAIIAQITGHEEDLENKWPGTKIVLYNDPNVMFKGKIVGGIRVRAPKPGSVKQPAKSAPVQATVPAPQGDMAGQPQEELPF